MKEKNKLTIILAITSAILLVAVVVLCCVLLILHQKEDEIPSNQQYYDNKCLSYTIQNSNIAKGQIVFVGDSITDFYILDEHYNSLPLATYNRGIGGDTTTGVLKRLKLSIYDIEPSAVVLMIGTNDVNGGESNKDILIRYEKIVKDIYKNLPNVSLYCISVIPQNEDLEGYSGIDVDKTTRQIIELNKGISELAAANGATYLDLFTCLSDENNRLIKEYSDDGLHLNKAGLSVWTSLLKPYLEEISK